MKKVILNKKELVKSHQTGEVSESCGDWGDSPSTGSSGGSPGGGWGAKPRKSGSRDGVTAGFGAEPQEGGGWGGPPPNSSYLNV
jgi:hypothetical protein